MPSSLHPEPWPRARWIRLCTLVFAAQLLLIWALAPRPARESAPRRTEPRFQHLPSGGAAAFAFSEFDYSDPLVFALDHAEGFSGAAWKNPGFLKHDPVPWTEPARCLEIKTGDLAARFSNYVERNQPSWLAMAERPPAPALRLATGPSRVRTASVLELAGPLAERGLSRPMELPTLPGAAILTPTSVRVLVNDSGLVLSAVVITSSGAAAADQRALELARAARFKPVYAASASGIEPVVSGPLTFGQMIFHWVTAPPPSVQAASPAPAP